uniref:EB domain-containing protein n=2 Tax=Bursaphelenchus xylophilus TaxID=6326 RepID=A0A1I7SNZ9_BURXY
MADKCLVKSSLGDRCLSSKQCPEFAECRFGLCQCQCGYKQSSFIGGLRCSNPDDPLNINTFLNGVEQLFGQKQRAFSGP